MSAQQCTRDDPVFVREHLLPRKLLGLCLRRKAFGSPSKRVPSSPLFWQFNRNEPMIFYRVSGHDVYSTRIRAGLFALKESCPQENGPGCIRRGHQVCHPTGRPSEDARSHDVSLSRQHHCGRSTRLVGHAASSSSDREQASPASRRPRQQCQSGSLPPVASQSWADPRVSALGAALVTAPF